MEYHCPRCDRDVVINRLPGIEFECPRSHEINDCMVKEYWYDFTHLDYIPVQRGLWAWAVDI